MRTHLLTEGGSAPILADTARVTRKRLRERAVELAVLDGRAPQDAGKSDWERAKHDLIGEHRLELEAATMAPNTNDLTQMESLAMADNTPDAAARGF